MAPGQALLDGILALQQPAHGAVEEVFAEVGKAEERGQGIGSGGGLEAAGGGELGAGVSETGDDQGHHQIALRAGRTQTAIQADLAQGVEEGSDVAVGLGANDVKGIFEAGDDGALLEQDAQPLDQFGRPLGEIGEGAFLDLAVLAVGLAQENGRGGLAVGEGNPSWFSSGKAASAVKGRCTQGVRDRLKTRCHLCRGAVTAPNPNVRHFTPQAANPIRQSDLWSFGYAVCYQPVAKVPRAPRPFLRPPDKAL